MNCRDIQIGARIRITVDGVSYRHFIVDMKDGRVVLANTRNGKGSKWWLPYEYVKEHGELLK